VSGRCRNDIQAIALARFNCKCSVYGAYMDSVWSIEHTGRAHRMVQGLKLDCIQSNKVM
jgi:hypothetical protein